MPRWVILGCGYTGERLVSHLIGAGHEVVATTRSAERAEVLNKRFAGRAQVVVGEVLDCLDAVSVADARVVFSVPPREPFGVLERSVVAAAVDVGAERFVYLSSTGVFGRGDGSWTDERTPTGPLGARGVARLAAEQAVREVAGDKLKTISLRIAGIYGPGRGVAHRLRHGTYRIYGEGSALVSRIHVDDLVLAIDRAGTAVSPSAIYCIADDAPTSSRDHADGIAALLGIDPPPSVAASEASDAARAMLGANRRISNRLAKSELGWTLTYPSWREGVSALIGDD